MNKADITAALAVANDKSIHFIDDNGKHLVDISIFDGYGLPGFEPVHCTVRQLAFLIRWQCFQMNGEINALEFDNLCRAGRRLFHVIRTPAETVLA